MLHSSPASSRLRSARRSARRADAITLAPSRAKRIAVSRPIPLDAPTISTTLSFSDTGIKCSLYKLLEQVQLHRVRTGGRQDPNAPRIGVFADPRLFPFNFEQSHFVVAGAGGVLHRREYLNRLREACRRFEDGKQRPAKTQPRFKIGIEEIMGPGGRGANQCFALHVVACRHKECFADKFERRYGRRFGIRGEYQRRFSAEPDQFALRASQAIQNQESQMRGAIPADRGAILIHGSRQPKSERMPDVAKNPGGGAARARGSMDRFKIAGAGRGESKGGGWRDVFRYARPVADGGAEFGKIGSARGSPFGAEEPLLYFARPLPEIPV